MGVNALEQVTVQDLLREHDEVEVEARCQRLRCRRTFGRWVFWEDGDLGVNVSWTGMHGRTFKPEDVRLERTRGRTRSQIRGPRTGSGMRWEGWSPDGDPNRQTLYLRKTCKCGDNRKWSVAKLAALPVRMEPTGPAVYL